MKKLFKHMNIQKKIVLLYFLALILSFVFTFLALSVINEKYTEREVGNAGVQTIKALQGNLELIQDSVKQFSDLIYFDSYVQDSLRQIDSSSIDPDVQQTIQKSLINMLLSGDYISTASIFDIYYNDYNSYKSGPILVKGEKIQNTKWYEKMKQANGSGFFIHKSEDVLEFPTKNDKNYISFVREIRDQDTYEHLAILLLSIDEETLQECFREVSGANDSQFFILDEKGNYIVNPIDTTKDWKQYIPPELESGYKMVSTDDGKMVCIRLNMGIEDWSLVGMMPMNEMEMKSSYFFPIIAFVIGLNMCFLFFCSLMLSKLIFFPLSKVENHMKLVEEGTFSKMPLGDGENEINTLKRVFNRMVESIENLIERVKEEEKIIAKNELDIIQAQINPHFLYNTLDAVSALALIEDNENCFRMAQALGHFYRNSLNSGKNFVTVEDEIDCIRNYMTILNMRYDNKIDVQYEIEEEILTRKMLKLILQPVIENAVHHGLREKEGDGLIIIQGYREDKELIFIVTDNGCGMTEERIQAVLKGETKRDKRGFGMYSLIQRISLYYHIDEPLMIHSEVGSGTEITIRIGIMEEES